MSFTSSTSSLYKGYEKGPFSQGKRREFGRLITLSYFHWYNLLASRLLVVFVPVDEEVFGNSLYLNMPPQKSAFKLERSGLQLQ